MRLRVTDPSAVLVDCEVVSVRAEDASGGFGILAGHADLVTALDTSIVSWRNPAGHESYCAVHNGVLTVNGGSDVSIATRGGFVGDNLEALQAEVRARYSQQHDLEQNVGANDAKLRLKAIRHIVEALQSGPKEIGL